MMLAYSSLRTFLQMCVKRVAANIVPKLINFEQKQRCMDVAHEMLKTFNDDIYLLKKVITYDDSGMYGYDIETKAKSVQWKAYYYD